MINAKTERPACINYKDGTSENIMQLTCPSEWGYHIIEPVKFKEEFTYLRVV
jgi:hypothetical protein